MRAQPPSGGCVLKRAGDLWDSLQRLPAAFRRLCVETSLTYCITIQQNQPPSGGCVLKPKYNFLPPNLYKPAAFRRLCVETGTSVRGKPSLTNQPPSGGCVLKPIRGADGVLNGPSRLQAAVC